MTGVAYAECAPRPATIQTVAGIGPCLTSRPVPRVGGKRRPRPAARRAAGSRASGTWTGWRRLRRCLRPSSNRRALLNPIQDSLDLPPAVRLRAQWCRFATTIVSGSRRDALLMVPPGPYGRCRRRGRTNRAHRAVENAARFPQPSTGHPIDQVTHRQVKSPTDSAEEPKSRLLR